MKTTKRMLSVLLSMLIALTGLVGLCVPVNAAFNVGDWLYYGSYPQTEVTDTLGSTLNALSSVWTSYGYNDSDCMMYSDVTYNGEKYRGVMITSNRPIGGSYSNTQKDNGYLKGNTYWFKYEPIR